MYPQHSSVVGYGLSLAELALADRATCIGGLAERFQKAGGKQVYPVETHFYEDRTAQVENPKGYKWTLTQHVEDMTPEEMQRSMEKMMGRVGQPLKHEG